VPAVPVLLVGDDPLARGGLAGLLVGRAEIRVVAQAAPDDVERAIAADPPAAAAWDLGAGGGEDAMRVAAGAGVAVVALASSQAQAGAAWRAGARGLLPRSATGEALAGALVAVAQGLAVLDPDLAAELVRPPELPAAAEGLTPREREVMQLLAEGLANKTIAARLGISEHTAKFHVNAILGKLGAESRAEAIVRAARLGLVVL
jgi:two-component system, NarL family, nitrate/nitrite response regulator NarL